MKPPRGPVTLLVALLGLALASPASAAGGLRVGAAAVSLAPPDGVPLAGFGNRGPGNRAEGVLAPVEARALVVKVPTGERVGVVVLDVLILWPSLRRAIASRVTDLELASLLVAASHTHSGPGGYVDQWIAEVGIMGWFESATLDALADAAAAALHEAAGRMAAARLGSRQALVPGLTRNRRRPDGPGDPVVPVLRIDDLEGRALATLFALSAHPTTLAAENRLLSPDYPGAARDRVEARRGGLAIFLAGALGDQAPALPGGVLWTDDTGISLAEQIESSNQLGARLGDLVADTARQIPLEPDPVVAWSSVRWPLPPVDIRARCVGLVLGPVLYGSARSTFPREARIDALRLGELRILGSPFELSAEVAEAIRERTPRPLLVAAHVNAWLGYLVSPEDWARGGYETCLSFHGPDLAPDFVDQAVGALGALGTAKRAEP